MALTQRIIICKICKKEEFRWANAQWCRDCYRKKYNKYQYKIQREKYIANGGVAVYHSTQKIQREMPVDELLKSVGYFDDKEE
jgi:hypothetical protein